MCVRKTAERAAAPAAMLLWFSLWALALGGAAQGLPNTPPLPPPRPVMPHEAKPAPGGDLAPAQRGEGGLRPQEGANDQPPGASTNERAPDARSVGDNRADRAHDPPWPPEDRAALRACAVEWQRMLEAGAAGIITWRQFAPGCLARHARPRE